MKKKLITTIILGICMSSIIISCGDSKKDDNKKETKTVATSSVSAEKSTKTSETSTIKETESAKNEEDSSKENGIVLKQSIDAGKEVEQGSKITITVNKLTETKSATLTINVKSLLGGKVDYEEVPTNTTTSSNSTNTNTSTNTNSSINKVVKEVEVKIVVGSDTVYKSKIDPTTTNLYQTISGKGTVVVKVYVDDVLKSTKDVNLNNTDKVTIE